MFLSDVRSKKKKKVPLRYRWVQPSDPCGGPPLYWFGPFLFLLLSYLIFFLLFTDLGLSFSIYRLPTSLPSLFHRDDVYKMHWSAILWSAVRPSMARSLPRRRPLLLLLSPSYKTFSPLYIYRPSSKVGAQ